ncbi:hypothetical protein GDO81_019031 [Engystomops pustulosus]|uniref:Uncharacterized protein n=1 Tax=Engystomops pustulosus TaxID=76066 RepID=A0AAV6YH83_ENGPU|nr:hypothetical protein GDO81_019031 [Engystomops pustulosus]
MPLVILYHCYYEIHGSRIYITIWRWDAIDDVRVLEELQPRDVQQVRYFLPDLPPSPALRDEMLHGLLLLTPQGTLPICHTHKL